MIRNSHCPMTPCGSGFYQILCFCKTIHGTHLCMGMKLYSLDGSIVFPLFNLRLFQILHHDGYHILIGVPFRITPNLDKASRFDIFADFIPFIFRYKSFDTNGGGFIRNQKCHQFFAVVYGSRIQLKDHTLNGHCSTIRSDFPYGYSPVTVIFPHDAVSLHGSFFFSSFPTASVTVSTIIAAAVSCTKRISTGNWSCIWRSLDRRQGFCP